MAVKKVSMCFETKY